MRSSIDWARLQVSVALPEAYKQANNLAKIKFDCLQLSVQIKDRLRNFHLSTKKKKKASRYRLLRKVTNSSGNPTSKSLQNHHMSRNKPTTSGSLWVTSSVPRL